jgi:nucleoside 2-deoxyribosyltransferase
METYNNLKVFRYEDSPESVKKSCLENHSIFLAGPTVRGNQPHLTSWRFEAIDIFKKLDFNGYLVVPEFTSKQESDKGKKCIPLWEFNGLISCDVILFWIPRTKELIGLTTNWELGYWIGRDIGKVIYGRPDDAYRIDYLDTMWEAIHNENGTKPVIYNTLEDTIKASIKK